MIKERFFTLLLRSAVAVFVIQLFANTQTTSAVCATHKVELGCGGCACGGASASAPHGCAPGYCGEGCEWEENACFLS